MRLIDADKAKEKLRGNAQNDGSPFVGVIVEVFCEFLDQAVEDAEEHDEIGRVPRWIPVTERMPETDDMVLAYCPSKKETPLETVMSGWAAMIYASHWMPLPEPPEVE